MTKESVVWSPFGDLWEQTLVWLLVQQKALMGLPRHQRQNPHPQVLLLAHLGLDSSLPALLAWRTPWKPRLSHEARIAITLWKVE